MASNSERRIANKSPNLSAMTVGDCYANAFQFFLQNRQRYESMRLVHGYPTIEGNVYGHAWIEWDGTAYDPTSDQELPQEEYYATLLIDASDCRKYSKPEALKHMESHGNWGPWESVKDNAIFQDKNRLCLIDGTGFIVVGEFFREPDALPDWTLWEEGEQGREIISRLLNAGVQDGDIAGFFQGPERLLVGLCVLCGYDLENTDEASFTLLSGRNAFVMQPPVKLPISSADPLRIDESELIGLLGDEFEQADEIRAWLHSHGYRKC